EAALAIRRAPGVRASLRRVHVLAHHRRGCRPSAWTVHGRGCHGGGRAFPAGFHYCAQARPRGNNWHDSAEGRCVDASRRISQRAREFRRDPTHARARLMDTRDRKSVLCFLALTFGISSIFWVRSFRGAPLNSVVPFLMWTPGVCALVT